MKADPPVRPDGLCVLCLEPRQVAKLKPLYRVQAADDPFCSQQCCRAWWGTSLPVIERPRVTTVP